MKPKVFGICSKDSNAMKSANPNSGFYETETARTIDTSSQSPVRNQGGMVVIEGNGMRTSHHGDGFKESETMYTLNTIEHHAVAHPIYTTSKASFHTTAHTDVADTLVASDFKDPPTVTGEPYCIVRRLTPTECARLQGFPDWWCSNLGIENPSEQDMEFWRGVSETHRNVVSGASKPKTDAQIRKWLANPHSDSAEYKMWGNGIALPCAVFVLSGIVQHAKKH